MPWVESVSPSFRARHDSRDADDAAQVLESLERARDRLDAVFARTVGDLTVVLHQSDNQLRLARPLLPVARLLVAPAARRYVVGSVSRDEIHVLSPAAARERASNVPGSLEMLRLAPAALYARRVLAEVNPGLPPPARPGRVVRGLRWAWLVEGAARFLVGQVEHARPAIARRLHEGERPQFPPGVRDATLLGGTVVELLVREQGPPAVARMVERLHPDGPRAALVDAFGGRPLGRTEDAWRSHLARYGEGRRPAGLAQDIRAEPGDDRHDGDGDQEPG
ncbi:MAG: hypothetical protein QOK31_944 [Solirubrobacteraceae bacterium]|nr:hypothetical protein [Solirubrobacteraceae bacterium]